MIMANRVSGTADLFPHSIIVFLPCFYEFHVGVQHLDLQIKEMKLNQKMGNAMLCVCVGSYTVRMQFLWSHLYSVQIMSSGLLLLLHQNQNRSKAARNQHLETRAETHALELLHHMCRQITGRNQMFSSFGLASFFCLTWNNLSAERKREEGGEFLLSINTERPFSLAAGLMRTDAERQTWQTRADWWLMPTILNQF